MPLPVEVADLTPEVMTALLDACVPGVRVEAALDDLDALGALTNRLGTT